MLLIALFGVGLLAAVSLSGLVARTVLSTSLLFLLAGALVGPGGFGLVDITTDSPIIVLLADVALVSVLFADGQRASLPALRSAGRLAGRALLLGLPLTIGGIAVFAHFAAGLPWLVALLVGAILAPTDPVFAAAIIGRRDVPARLRGLLNVEAGLNDGLALPIVVLLIAASTDTRVPFAHLVLELAGGLLLGIVAAAAVALLWRVKALGAEPRLQPLGPLALGVTVYATSQLLHLNPYLAAFGAGVALATLAPTSSHSYEQLGEMISESAKFAALLVFGALLTPALLAELSVGGWLTVAATILLVRPAVMVLSLWGAKLSGSEKLAAAWFGPRGFASVVFGLLAVRAEVPMAETAFALVAVTIAASVVLHSSTDVPIARLLHVPQPASLPSDLVSDDPAMTLALDQTAPPASRRTAGPDRDREPPAH